MKKLIISAAAILLAAVGAQAQRIERVEPMNWWAGMNTPLQVMFYGPGVGKASVRVLEKGLRVTNVHKADSPNYLFVDVEVNPKAAAGDYTFEFTLGGEKFTQPYRIGKRREGWETRESFSSKDLVYLIMPDRFANGDPSNDNTPDTADKADRGYYSGRHGGDLQGVIDHLDYIADLGVTAIWSTPWTLDNEPRVSYHGYACSDYYKIDPRFGSNELYAEMVAEGHKRGVKTIMDIVTNHCGTAHWWMQDLPFADWINQHPTFTNTNGAMSMPMDPNASRYDQEEFYRGWFARSMPDTNLSNPFMLQYFKQWAVWWIENMNLDGFRVDTYPYNDKEKMAEWVQSVRAEYPNFSIVGESWLPHPSQIAYWIGGNGNRDGFDSHLPFGMDFPLMAAVHNALRGGDRPTRERGSAGEIYEVITQDFLYEDPAHDLMIFLDNHDTEHIADVAAGNPDKVKIALSLMATMRGMPQMWVGTELMFRSQDLRVGHGSARIDFPGAWPGDTRNLFEEADRTADEQAVYSHARRIFNWRKGKDVIHSGRTMQFMTRDGLYVYFRYNDTEAVMTALNISARPVEIDWAKYAEMVADGAEGRDIVSGAGVRAGDSFVLPAYGNSIIEFKR